ncbi:MAG: tetratricopeptide repeat protein [Coriobacteriia bacterium]|nr:tetratricopeptide repeat protein [Coriobacteriia bacterium]
MTQLSGDAAGAPDPRADESLVPGWLAILVLLLLLAIVGVGGFVLRGIVEANLSTDPRSAEVARWERAVSATPADANARLSLAYALQKAGRTDEAIKEYDTVLKADPKNTAALYNTGVIYMARGESRKAEAWWWRALDAEPTHALAAKSLGDYYSGLGHYRSVVKAVRPAVQAKPSLADLQYLMGVAYENLGRSDWARERYALALRYAPDMSKASEGLKRVGGETP